MAKISNVYYTASDATALAGFYREALGLADKFADPGRWIQFAVNGVNFAVSTTDESSSAAGGGAVVTFQVDDLDVSLSLIAAAGGAQAGPIRDMGSHGRTVPCKDLEGNVFQLIQQ